MASSSSSSSQTPATALTELSNLPCIRALHLDDTTSSAVLDVAQSVKHDQEASGQHVLLAAKTLAEAKTWSSVLVSSSAWAKVAALRAQLITESESVCFQFSTLSFFPVNRLGSPGAFRTYPNSLAHIHRHGSEPSSPLPLRESHGGPAAQRRRAAQEFPDYGRGLRPDDTAFDTRRRARDGLGRDARGRRLQIGAVD
ncbi:hypothetical protein BR93DRAFT_927057 [Coniochaeta sp. PMI_546]|nr:hypothetical protein BR93DRAFT_927057 [Coniochaeta sp. PMI_546]